MDELESPNDDVLEQLSLYNHTRNNIQNDNLPEDHGHLGDIYQLEPKQKPDATILNHIETSESKKGTISTYFACKRND